MLILFVNTLSWSMSGIRHPELLEILRKVDLVTADGMPLVWVSKLLGKSLKERVTEIPGQRFLLQGLLRHIETQL